MRSEEMVNCSGPACSVKVRDFSRLALDLTNSTQILVPLLLPRREGASKWWMVL
jgi:hypothetical protein